MIRVLGSIVSLRCLLDIQMERSSKKLNRSLEDEGEDHAREEFFSHQWVTFKQTFQLLYSGGGVKFIFLCCKYSMFLCTQVQYTGSVSDGSFDHIQQKLALDSYCKKQGN